MSGAGKFEVPAGAIDGVNTVFTVSRPYAALSVAVFVNGQLRNRPAADGWTETNPSNGTVTLSTAPLLGDEVQIFYLDGGPGNGDTVEVSPLVGKLVAIDDLKGVALPTQELNGVLTTS